MYSFETIAGAFPAIVEPSPAAAAGDDDKLSLSDWMSAACSDQDWHNNSLKAVGHLITKGLSDENIHTLLDSALTRPSYQVDQTHAEIQKMIDGGRKKKWGVKVEYDPGGIGPMPLGYTRDGNFALRDQSRHIIVSASSNQLLSQQSLMALANSQFWAEQFPSSKSLFNAYGAGEALIAACLKVGAFDPLKVRGRGIWLEGNREIINLGGPVPPDTNYLYLCFERLPIQVCDHFDTQRLLNFLELFNWRNPQDAMLLLGWLAIAPICGVLKNRPHCFVHGPPRCGKTTLHRVAKDLLYPLVISADGQSSEAGLRQRVGPDSLPIVIDEFESDHNPKRLSSVVKLTRSAYSADTQLLRGTPEGKAMVFSLRTIFYLSAVNPPGMEPADETRFVMLEISKHDSDEFTARLITEEEEHYADKGPEWCGYMASLVNKINPTINIFQKVMLGMDIRLRDNMATFLAGAFVALHGREPTKDEARDVAAKFAGTIKSHGEGFERDEAQECLAHLLSHIVDQDMLGQWLAQELNELKQGRDNRFSTSRRILTNYGLKLEADGEKAGLYVAHGTSNLEKVFTNTKWGGRAWQRALKKVSGAFAAPDPVYFPILGKKRCVVLPLDVLPELAPRPYYQ